MHAQIFYVVPKAGAGLRFAGQAGKRIHQIALFFHLFIQKAIRLARRSKGESEDVDDQQERKCNHPPKGYEIFAHCYELLSPAESISLWGFGLESAAGGSGVAVGG